MNEIEDQLKQILKSLIQDKTISCNAEIFDSKSFNCMLKIENDKEITFIHENMFESKPDIVVHMKFFISFTSFYILECHINSISAENTYKSGYDSYRKILLSETEFNTFKEILFKRQIHELNETSANQFSCFITDMQKYLEANKVISHIDDL